jgi:hypothetical protein
MRKTFVAFSGPIYALIKMASSGFSGKTGGVANGMAEKEGAGGVHNPLTSLFLIPVKGQAKQGIRCRATV